MEAPQGTVTFVFTDIVGSTRLWEKFPSGMGHALRVHDSILREIFLGGGGHVFKTVGDAFCVAFEQPSSALRAAMDVHRRLANEDWGTVGQVAVRIGIHSGPAEFRGNDYFGGTVNRTARIESAAHGGQILISGITRDLLRDDPPGAAGFRDLGEHRLRSLERPEHLFQVVGDGLIADFPPPKSMDVLPNNLPVQTTSFIGRDKEMNAVTAALDGKTRLLTLVGTGGTGKTRLAIEAGARHIGAFREGVWLVELALVSDASRLLQTVTASLGLREEPGRPLQETLLGFLKPKKILLILDNCEQLTGSVASLCVELLKTCPDLKILATSRHSLGIAGEATQPVPPLSILDINRTGRGGPAFASEIAEYDAVKLFVERAAAVRPEFVLTHENAPAIAEICSRLDGIPLAIELAAARIRLLDVRQIAERLVDRFRLLRGGATDRLPHQQTLQALIDWSYDLLSDDEKILLRRLSVFVAGRGLEAIEVVCGADPLDPADILDLLQQLVEKSLVTVEENDHGGPRFTMLESVWHYARTKLRESGEQNALRDRHLEYFLNLAEEAGPHFSGPKQKHYLELFNEDVFNFEAAVRWSVKTSRALESVRFLAALGRPLEVRGYLSEAREQYLAILDMATDIEPVLLAKATASASRLAWAMDLYDEAGELFTRAEELATSGNDPVLAGLCHSFLGFMDRGNGFVDAAGTRFEYGMKVAEQTGSLPLRALCLSGLGRVALSRGELSKAREMIEESLLLYRGLGDLWIVGLILWGTARVAIAQKDVARAESALCEWAGIVESLGNGWLLPYVIEAFAVAAMSAGESERASALFGGAEAMRERLGARFTQDEQEEHDSAIEHLRSVIDPVPMKKLWKQGSEKGPADLLLLARRELSQCNSVV